MAGARGSRMGTNLLFVDQAFEVFLDTFQDDFGLQLSHLRLVSFFGILTIISFSTHCERFQIPSIWKWVEVTTLQRVSQATVKASGFILFHGNDSFHFCLEEQSYVAICAASAFVTRTTFNFSHFFNVTEPQRITLTSAPTTQLEALCVHRSASQRWSLLSPRTVRFVLRTFRRQHLIYWWLRVRRSN